MKNIAILFFILFFHSANAQQTIDKLNANQLKLPKESVNKALYLDGAGQVKSSSTISDTELGYLEGLTDTLVNLLSGKANDTDVVKLTGNQTVDGIKTFSGKLVALSTVNGSIPCPVMTEAQRDLFTPVEGDCVYNSDTLKLNIFDGSVWKDVGGAGGISLWLTANPYNVNDIIIESDKIYRCLIAHTSGTFATDLAASKWTEVSASPVTPYALADGGTNKALTATNGGIVWVDADSFEILSAGVSGQVLQSNGAASPSWVNKSISGKAENASAVTLEEIQVSNNQLTQTDTNKHLVETGNTNILSNPSFEHSTFSTGWTNAAGVFALESTVVVHGKKSAKVTLSSQALDLSQDSTLYQAQFADGVQGLASVRIKTTVTGLRVCSRQNGVVTSNLCVDVQANGKWGLYKVPFILGATSNGIEIDSNGVLVTGDVYVDDAFVGAVDLSADVDQSRVAGEAYFAGTTSCIWNRTNTAIGAFTATAACPGPTVVYSSMGQWQTTDSDLPRVTVNNLPAGVYKAKFFISHAKASGVPIFAINDGTSTCYGTQGQSSVGLYTPMTVECTFTYNSSGNRVFELFTGSANTANAINLLNDSSAPAGGTKFILEYFGSGSVYSSTNADTDWQSCTPSSTQGLGSPTFDMQCKREGSDLLMRGRIIPTAPTAVELRVGLPVWNGVQLTTSSLANAQYGGCIATADSGVTLIGGCPFNFIIEPSVTYLTAGYRDGTSGNMTKRNGSTVLNVNQSMNFTNIRVPIAGWTNSNVIIGTFNEVITAPGVIKPVIYTALLSSGGIVSLESGDWISGNCIQSAGLKTCTLQTNKFIANPVCFATVSGFSHGVRIDTATTSTVTVENFNLSGASTTGAAYLTCTGQAP